ncbi:MAG: hypothetical protein DME22_16630 [Verrucomicrobia bacterium]|nr:MAG: hypothetical protein DME22_16630 [Verrucomicrobiota bacterium]
MSGVSPLLLAAAFLCATAHTGRAQPTIQFSASSYTVAESACFATITVQRLSDPSTTVGVDFATTDGTATNGLKYTAVSGTLAFGAGETNKTIVVPILDEGFVEGSKTFRVILSNPTVGAVLGARTNATVRITDNDVGIQFQLATYSVAEDAGAVLIGIVRGDDGMLPATVDFATADLSAANGLDYTGTTNTLSFASDERLKFVPVPILNNSLKQPNRTFRATLANPAGASLGFQKTVMVTIVDNDQGFQFEFASYTITEDAGAALITVLRGNDDTNSTVTVDVATADVTATNGLDYTGVTNTLSFAPGERFGLITVPILNDAIKEPTKNFRVTLSNPTGGAALGSRTTATVSIVDNDPGVGFELGSYSVWENAGTIAVTVLRGNDVALGPITVDYATSNLTATAGQDYQAVSGTLAFNQNETVKAISIPILRDGSVLNNTSFAVTLSNLSGGATLGRASTTVNILDASRLTSRTVVPPFDTALMIRREKGVNLLTWTGGGHLQRADRSAGPWQTLTGATNPFTVQSPIPATFYRVTRPKPVNVYIPSSYDGQTPVPLVILLHSYSKTGAETEAYMQFRPLAEARRFLYCYPDSTIDRWGYEGWNATDAIGYDFGSNGVDDAGYLRSVIEEIGRQFAVDQKRIYLVGHSNGGFMAYGMGCQSADLIAGIASLAGMTFLSLRWRGFDYYRRGVSVRGEYASVSRCAADGPDLGRV